jgi:serine O-acetyltransferase
MGFLGRASDLVAAYRKYDPATSSSLEILLLYPGVKAWALHQLAHALYKTKIPFLPRAVSEFARWVTGIDIHPGATIGERVIIDHGMGVVIGETAVVEDDVLIYHGVTLGGTSLERKKRHPTIRRNCVLGSGAKILGNVEIGEGTRIGSNSVVVKDVPARCTVVGIPARIVSRDGVVEGQELEHGRLPDPVQQIVKQLEDRLARLEGNAAKVPQG